MKRFVFVDRDGTLVRDVGYPHRLEDYELLPGVVDGLTRLARAGFRLGIVTNQSGIGRGCYEEADFDRFQQRLLADLEAAGLRIEGTWMCPHAPDDGCACRKPEPGLLWRARDEAGADLESSWVIGDGERDVELARRAGCAGAVRLCPSPAPPGPDPYALRARDLPEAARLVLERAGRDDSGRRAQRAP